MKCPAVRVHNWEDVGIIIVNITLDSRIRRIVRQQSICNVLCHLEYQGQISLVEHEWLVTYHSRDPFSSMYIQSHG